MNDEIKRSLNIHRGHRVGLIKPINWLLIGAGIWPLLNTGLFCLLINAGASLLAGAAVLGVLSIPHRLPHKRGDEDDSALMKVNLSTSDVLIKGSKSGLIQTRREVAWRSGVINRGCVFPGDIPRRWRIRVHGRSTSVTLKNHFTGFKSTQQTRAHARARTFCMHRGHEVKLESRRASVRRDFI